MISLHIIKINKNLFLHLKLLSEILKIKSIDLSSFRNVDVALLCDQSSQFLNKATQGFGIDYLLNINAWEAPIKKSKYVDK